MGFYNRKSIKKNSFQNDNSSENTASETLTFGLYIGTSRSLTTTLALSKEQPSHREAEVA